MQYMYPVTWDKISLWKKKPLLRKKYFFRMCRHMMDRRDSRWGWSSYITESLTVSSIEKNNPMITLNFFFFVCVLGEYF